MALRQTQHKPKKETQEIRAKDVAELKSENQKLRRENARLKRELLKFDPSTVVEEEVKSVGEIENVPAKPAFSCPDCSGTEFTTLVLGPKTFMVCSDCKWRKIQKEQNNG